MTQKLTYFSLGGLALMSCTTSFAQITQKAWIYHFSVSAPTAMCRELMTKPLLKKKLAAQHINQNECIEKFKRSLMQCISKNQDKLPKLFTQSLGKQWGGLLGSCAATDFYDHYLAPTYTKAQFAKRLLVVPIIPKFCASPYMQNVLLTKKLTPKSCITKLTPYQKPCINAALANQPNTFKGTKVEKVIMHAYMRCLLAKSQLIAPIPRGK